MSHELVLSLHNPTNREFDKMDEMELALIPNKKNLIDFTRLFTTGNLGQPQLCFKQTVSVGLSINLESDSVFHSC